MELMIRTGAPRQVVDVTAQVQALLVDLGMRDGVCHIFVAHTTAGLTTADLDPKTDMDYLAAIEAITPKLTWNHPHDPSHFPDHFWASLIGASVQIPVVEGKLVLGEWQRVVLIEMSGPRTRRIIITGTAS